MKKKLLLFVLPIFLFAILLLPNNFSYADSSIEFIEDNGGFSNASEMIAYDNYLFVTDHDNSKVQIINQNTLKAFSFGKGGMQDQSTTTPTSIVCDNTYIYLCIGSSNYIKKFDYQGNYQNFYYDSYLDAGQSKTFNKINSLSIDTYGNLYALHLAQDLTASRILKYKDNNFVTLAIDELIIQDDSRLLMSASSDYMFVCSGTKITVIDSRSYTIVNTYTTSQTYTDIKIDYLDNIYYLNGNTITKLLAPSYTTSETITLDKDYKLFAFNQVDGKLFMLDEGENKVVNNQVTGIDHLSTFTKPRDYLDKTTLNTEKVSIATLTSTTIAYNYPYTLSSNITLSETDFVIVLDTNTANNSNFYYCLITSKKEYNIAVYIHKNHLIMVDPNETNLNNSSMLFTQAISSPTANIYKYPTSMLAEEGAQTAIVYSQSNLTAGDKVTAVRYLRDYEDYNGYSFYEVFFANGTYGYINANSIVNYNTEKEPTKIKPNATIRTSDEREFINLYIKNGNSYTLVQDFVLLDGTRVRLVGNFDKSAEYTEVKYVDDGEVKTAFVKTKFIEMDGISFEIIIAILLALLCVIFTLILIAILKKNKKVTR